MRRSGGVIEAIVVTAAAIALFAIFFGAFLVVPLAVVIVGLLALAVSQRGGTRRAARANKARDAKLPDRPAPPAERSHTRDSPDHVV